MDIGYTYCSADRVRVSLYAPPGLEPPESFDLTSDEGVVRFLRLSDRSLLCGAVHGIPGDCRNFECHRRVLGECQCGRHAAPVPFSKAVS